MRPSLYYVVLPMALMALALFVAPMYGDVMEKVLSAGETFRAMCGF
jgi:hypothetical protein